MRRCCLGFVTVAGLAWGCTSLASPSHASENEIRITCPKSLTGKPPMERYRCTVDVLGTSAHARWLVFPFFMEDQLKPRQEIVSLQMIRGDDGAVSLWALESDDAFAAIFIPAGKRLHIQEWELSTNTHATDLKVWLGGELFLSTGDALSAVLNRLAAKPTRTHDWTAPRGAQIAFDPNSFQSLRLHLPPRKN